MALAPRTSFCYSHIQIRIPSSSSVKMANSHSPNYATSSKTMGSMRENRRLPILLFDVMDTIVRDPFYQDVPAFFRTPFKKLLNEKHPKAWIEFEEGLINEEELAKKFFKDGRHFDLQGLKECMKNGYSYLEGMESLLCHLKHNGYEMHAFTNYPNWYMLIEEKLKLSAYISWSFCSCEIGRRKPEPDAYLEVLQHLAVDPASCVFIDDRETNVEAAINTGMNGIHFKGAMVLEQELLELGIETGGLEPKTRTDVSSLSEKDTRT